jgi:hypothetical protein
MTDTMTIEEAENKDVTIGKFSVTGYDCVKSSTAILTKETQETVLEQIVRGAGRDDIVETVYDAACSIDAKDPDWDRLGVPQGLRQTIDRKNADQDGYYSWSKTGDHPQGENPRAAWFANHLLGTDFGQGDKPLRAKVRPGQSVGGAAVDVIAYEDATDLTEVDLTMDVQEMQRKCLENPLEDILEARGIEVDAAMIGKIQTQSDLEAFA